MAEHDNEILRRQYAQHIDLYKFYLETVIKANSFHYAVTGAILSFVFARPEVKLAKWCLALPLLLSIGLAVLFAYGARLLSISRDDVFELRDRLGLEAAPDMQVLTLVLTLFAIIQSITAIGLLLALFLV